MIRPISISLSPNTETDDILAAFALLFQPWRWKRGKEIELLEQDFKNYLGVSSVVSFNSGRSAFLAILESLGFQKEDEILIQAFTCNAVPNPILWSGLKPVYVDCKEDYNMSSVDLEKKITPRSRVVLVQHTFGFPADMDKIQEICTKYNLILLEDCAHALGARYKGRKVGTFGKASFFSFSRDKVISSVYGGMVATNDVSLAESMREFQKKAGYPFLLWIFQQLLHPVIMNWGILPLYGIGGKYMLRIDQYLHVLSKAVHKKEKRGVKPGYFPKALPNALAMLARKQLQKLNRFNSHRRQIAALYAKELLNTNYKMQDIKYQEGNIFLRFSVRHQKAHEIIKKAWRQNLLLGDWYTTPIAPHDTQIEKMGYEWGSCPVAEELAKTTLNLPTHIRIAEKEAGKIIQFLKSFQP
ncbi:aminotransferase class I/II-fold pyridoxal phosphate-dependent enzyme [Patescibacteria group bacterium]|nr:aminotransferase class I/II-fold pyridoxal phosphate-dependent enzyme [Patescibacteria group bacterium]